MATDNCEECELQYRFGHGRACRLGLHPMILYNRMEHIWHCHCAAKTMKPIPPATNAIPIPLNIDELPFQKGKPMSDLVTITVVLDLDDKIQNPLKVSQDAGQAIAQKLEDVYSHKDDSKRQIRTVSISATTSKRLG